MNYGLLLKIVILSERFSMNRTLKLLKHTQNTLSNIY